jgi:hypothetical protein
MVQITELTVGQVAGILSFAAALGLYHKFRLVLSVTSKLMSKEQLENNR